jgi:hypothetical protein
MSFLCLQPVTPQRFHRGLVFDVVFRNIAVPVVLLIVASSLNRSSDGDTAPDLPLKPMRQFLDSGGGSM